MQTNPLSGVALYARLRCFVSRINLCGSASELARSAREKSILAEILKSNAFSELGRGDILLELW